MTVYMNKLSQTISIRMFAAGMAILASVACSSRRTVVIEPVESDSVLVNPGMGFTTFYSFNGDERNQGHPESSIAYFRWYWDMLEPQEGRVNFAMIDSILALCQAHGQKLAFRVMCQNGHENADKTVEDSLEVPRWFRESAPGFLYPDRKHWQPDYDSAEFLEKHGALIRALGARYDGHPDLDHVDIGSVGRWGEWHTSGLDLPMPKAGSMTKIIDFYLESFVKTRLVMNVDEGFALEYAIVKGTGWRADCIGDMRQDWSHMRVAYPVAIREHRLSEVWTRAPVVFETCWNMLHWQEMGWDADSILATALEWHVSVLNNKSFPVPEGWEPRIEEFQKKMGYRFVLRRMEHPAQVHRGELFELRLDWENLGVAPSYRNYPPALELRAVDGSATRVIRTDSDITDWLPGPRSIMLVVEVPSDLPAGEYTLGLALIDPESGEPGIRLAIEGREADGWYRLSRIKIR